MKEVTHNEAKTFAYGFAPFFFGLALFVGGIIAWMLFTPLLARPLAQGLGSFRVVLASYAPTLFIGFIQATILYLVVGLALGMQYANPVGTYLFMLLMVAMFMAMIQMFNALLGPAVGRVLTLAFLMVQLTSAGGIYPVRGDIPAVPVHPLDRPDDGHSHGAAIHDPGRRGLPVLGRDGHDRGADDPVPGISTLGRPPKPPVQHGPPLPAGRGLGGTRQHSRPIQNLDAQEIARRK